MTKPLSLSAFIAASLAAAAIVAGLLWGSFALANPIFYLLATPSAATTTTLVYLPATGATSQATSTALDAYALGTTAQGFASNALVVQDLASSTSSSLNIRFQYSTDGIVWADDNYTVAATSSTTTIAQPLSYTWLAAGTATTTKILPVPTPTRYVRAIFTNTGAQSAIWYTWSPAKQNP